MMMKKLIARTLTLVLLALNLVALSATAHAQGNIELRGTVIDETRAFIPAAPVVLDDGKGQKYTTHRRAGALPLHGHPTGRLHDHG
jgi:type 1 fimbria pilin